MIKDQTFTGQRFGVKQFTGETLENCRFYRCHFDSCDLSEAAFTDCLFYDDDEQTGCSFQHAKLQDASFKHCDLTMADFKNIQALGLEIRESKATGADFSGASFMNMITARTWFCSAFMTKNNFSYANFSKVILEKCELWENRWTGANVQGANLSGSDLSGGEFTEFDWNNVNITHCDLTNSDLGELNLRKVDLDGVKIDDWQQSHLLERLGVVVIFSK